RGARGRRFTVHPGQRHYRWRACRWGTVWDSPAPQVVVADRISVFSMIKRLDSPSGTPYAHGTIVTSASPGRTTQAAVATLPRRAARLRRKAGECLPL